LTIGPFAGGFHGLKCGLHAEHRPQRIDMKALLQIGGGVCIIGLL